MSDMFDNLSNRLCKILASTLALLICGCASNNDMEAKKIWLSSSSDSQQKIKAVKRLVPSGASYADVIKILGPGIPGGHWHGITINVPIDSNNITTEASEDTNYDYYLLEYPTTNGFIALRFYNANDSAGFSTLYFSNVSYLTITNLAVTPLTSNEIDSVNSYFKR